MNNILMSLLVLRLIDAYYRNIRDCFSDRGNYHIPEIGEMIRVVEELVGANLIRPQILIELGKNASEERVYKEQDVSVLLYSRVPFVYIQEDPITDLGHRMIEAITEPLEIFINRHFPMVEAAGAASEEKESLIITLEEFTNEVVFSREMMKLYGPDLHQLLQLSPETSDETQKNDGGELK